MPNETPKQRERREYMREYYLKNKDKIREASQAYVHESNHEPQPGTSRENAPNELEKFQRYNYDMRLPQYSDISYSGLESETELEEGRLVIDSEAEIETEPINLICKKMPSSPSNLEDKVKDEKHLPFKKRKFAELTNLAKEKSKGFVNKSV